MQSPQQFPVLQLGEGALEGTLTHSPRLRQPPARLSLMPKAPAPHRRPRARAGRGAGGRGGRGGTHLRGPRATMLRTCQSHSLPRAQDAGSPEPGHPPPRPANASPVPRPEPLRVRAAARGAWCSARPGGWPGRLGQETLAGRGGAGAGVPGQRPGVRVEFPQRRSLKAPRPRAPLRSRRLRPGPSGRGRPSRLGPRRSRAPSRPAEAGCPQAPGEGDPAGGAGLSEAASAAASTWARHVTVVPLRWGVHIRRPRPDSAQMQRRVSSQSRGQPMTDVTWGSGLGPRWCGPRTGGRGRGRGAGATAAVSPPGKHPGAHSPSPPHPPPRTPQSREAAGHSGASSEFQAARAGSLPFKSLS